MENIIVFLYIAVIEIFIIDLSGSMEGLVKPLIKRILGINKKTDIKIPLIECSKCVIFHSGWIFLLCVGDFTAVNLCMVALVSFFSKNISGFLLWIQEALIKVEGWLYRLLKK